MYRSVVIGCGPRARRHLQAYAHVKSIRVAAAADLDEPRRAEFCRLFSLPRAYGDYRRMLAEEKPDIVHCVTQPSFRVEPVRACAEMGVKAVIVEKPLADSLAVAEEIERIAGDTGLKVIVNTQRRYFASWRACVQALRQPAAGHIEFIRCLTAPSIGCIGSHVIDMIEALLGDVDPTRVWGAACGAEDWHTNHPGPACALASISYPGRVQLLLEMNKHGVGLSGAPHFWGTMRIDVTTTTGRAWWTEFQGWGCQFAGMAQPVTQPTSFSDDDAAGQGAFTEAVATWLSDHSQPHGNRIETAMRVYRVVCAVLRSAASGQAMDYDPARRDDPLPTLRARLEAIEGVHPERVDWKTIRADT